MLGNGTYFAEMARNLLWLKYCNELKVDLYNFDSHARDVRKVTTHLACKPVSKSASHQIHSTTCDSSSQTNLSTYEQLTQETEHSKVTMKTKLSRCHIRFQMATGRMLIGND
eukprot:1668192-Amphidinium_carterae.1